jgi:hypothetical protein
MENRRTLLFSEQFLEICEKAGQDHNGRSGESSEEGQFEEPYSHIDQDPE